MARNPTIPATVVGAIGVVLAIIFAITISAGDVAIATIISTLAITAFAVLLTIYIMERMGPQTASAKATPAAKGSATPVANANAQATPATTRPVTKRTRVPATPVATPGKTTATAAAAKSTAATVKVTKSNKATVTTKTDAYYDFRGDVHDVIDVEGIGPSYAKRLKEIGIETTARLCYEDAGTIAKQIKAPKLTVEKWQAMAQLVKVNGIGKQYAEALVRAGIMGIDDLKHGDAELIAGQVTAYLASLENNVLGQSVTTKRVQGWQKKAQTMRRVRQTVPAQ